MKTTVSLEDFRYAFKLARREDFSYHGLKELFNYLEEYEDSTGEEVELDVIALCCDFSEDTWQEIESAYVIDMDDLEDSDDDAKKQRVIDYLIEEGAFVGQTDDTIVYRQH
jgi:hypothetical protein